MDLTWLALIGKRKKFRRRLENRGLLLLNYDCFLFLFCFSPSFLGCRKNKERT